MSIERIRFDEQPERLPPNNPAAEEAILGSVLLDREIIGQLTGILDGRDFYRERHGTIYAAMVALYERGDPVDYLTIVDELERGGALDAVGGATYVAGLIGAVPSPIHAEHYARIVADAAVARRLISAGGKIAQIGFANQEPVETLLERAEALLVDVVSRRAQDGGVVLVDALRSFMGELEVLASGTVTQTRIPSGFTDLDNVLGGGLGRSDLVVLAARPAMGKTGLALNIAARAAGPEWRAGVLIFSLEMSTSQVVARLVSTESGVDLKRLREGRLGEAESRKLGQTFGALAEMPIVIDDTSLLSIGTLRARVRRWRPRRTIDLVIVDHIGLMSGTDRRGENRVQELSEITRQLKALARDEHLPVLALSQLNRGVEARHSKIPLLSDLRESGSVEQDSDVVMFIYRDDYYDKDSERQGIADIHIAKHRNGPTGQVSLMFNQRTTRFLDLEVQQRW